MPASTAVEERVRWLTESRKKLDEDIASIHAGGNPFNDSKKIENEKAKNKKNPKPAGDFSELYAKP